ncbi:variant erythrocyte surface antigen-1 family protein, partial [Babesia divergens]
MVCYMYYTDVFVGSDNIDKLKKALIAELGDSVLTGDLTQLVQGLCLFMGYPSCLCKPKKSVKESLKKISGELQRDLKNYNCLSKLDLNCSSCSLSSVVCKCCVLDCINEVQKCKCVQGGSNKNCTCSKDDPKRCCKDLLEKLKASLSLLNLKADMEKLCQCPYDSNCCNDGVCTQKGSSTCSVCPNSKPSKDYTVTGLGLLRPSPKRLAERLENFFGDSGTSKNSCSCTCGSDKSCCCLACPGNCSQACSCVSSGCSCDKAPKTSPCPCKEFCIKINTIKVLEKSSDMTCCKSGEQCHCQLDPSNKCTPGSSGKCCVVDDKSGSGSNFQQSVKCMIRRLVKFFKDLPLDLSSKKDCSKLCCEIFCVLKICEFLRDFYGKGKKGGKDVCSKCNPGTKGKCPGSTLKSPSSNNCCGGKFESCSTSNCCLGCQECDAIKFRKALETLKLSSPCGQDLWRVLKDFLDYCTGVFLSNFNKKEVKEKINAAKEKCQQCKQAGTSKKPCTCSGSPCLGCQEIRGHNDIMSMLRHGYLSSYVNSKWEDLCSPGSKCCGNLSCSCSGSSCPDNGCCENCPKRLCAKIFLGMLPCLYFGLKIVYDRCKYGSDFPDWHLRKITEGSIGKFLTAWGYDVHPLKSKNASDLPPILDILFGSDKIFENLYNFVSEKYFTSSSSGSSSPSTVREMLLWLYGLRFQKHFSDLVSLCRTLSLPLDNAFHPDAVCYYLHLSCFLVPVSFISTVQHSDSHVSTFFPDADSEWQNFCYPSDPSDLLEKFCEYVRKIFVALNFLYYQCKNDRNSAGWNDCAFGKTCVEALKSSSPSKSPSTSSSDCSCPNSGSYLCTAINKDPVHDHCAQEKCRGFDSSASCSDSSKPGAHTSGKCTPCPHPLMRFLIDGSSDSDSKSKSQDPQKFRTPFHLPGIVPMGFKDLSSTGKKGWSLYYVLKVFCEDGFYPLSRLVQFVLCVSRYPPETLGEFFGFFMKFVESSVFRDHFASYVDGEPGRFLGNSLKGAIQGLYGAKDSHKGSGGSSHQDPSKTPADLQSLYNCHPKKDSEATCGKYLCSLTENAYKDFIKDFVDTYLSFVCHLGPKFKKELERFNSEAREKSLNCCLKSSSNCQNIVSCPCALPFLYKSGFTFWSPKTLSCHGSGGHKKGEEAKCTRKTCSDFIDQLGKVLEENSPLQTLLTVIDNFIWHIRLPFIYAF